MHQQFYLTSRASHSCTFNNSIQQMVFTIHYKKLLIITLLVIAVFLTQGQLRSDGCYSATIISKAGDTTFHILCFTSNGSWTDTSGAGIAPNLIRLPVGRNNERCTYTKNGNELTLTTEPINLPLYDVSNCPCKYRVRIQDDGIVGIEWRDNNKNKRSVRAKYFFISFPK